MALEDVLTTLVVEDRRDTRDSLRMLIDGTPGYRCIGAFGSVEQMLAQAVAVPVDAILLDIGLPGMSGIEGIPLILAKYPNAIVLMLTVYDDDERVFAALCAGASGYLLKKTAPARLLESIREAAAGGSPMSPEIARKVIRHFREFPQPKRTGSELTPHELRILNMLADGHNRKTAAQVLGVSVDAVAFHMKNIYEKLHVHSKSQAVAKALRTGIVH